MHVHKVSTFSVVTTDLAVIGRIWIFIAGNHLRCHPAQHSMPASDHSEYVDTCTQYNNMKSIVQEVQRCRDINY